MMMAGVSQATKFMKLLREKYALLIYDLHSPPPYDDGGDEGDGDEQHGAYHNEEHVEQVVLQPEPRVDDDQRIITTFVRRSGSGANF